jgi:hypothetical protein
MAAPPLSLMCGGGSVSRTEFKSGMLSRIKNGGAAAFLITFDF